MNRILNNFDYRSLIDIIGELQFTGFKMVICKYFKVRMCRCTYKGLTKAVFDKRGSTE